MEKKEKLEEILIDALCHRKFSEAEAKKLLFSYHKKSECPYLDQDGCGKGYYLYKEEHRRAEALLERLTNFKRFIEPFLNTIEEKTRFIRKNYWASEEFEQDKWEDFKSEENI